MTAYRLAFRFWIELIEKQRDISKCGQAKIEAIQEYEEASREFGRDGSAHARRTWKSHEPPIVPPGYGEWKT